MVFCRCYLLSTYHLKLKGTNLLLTSTFFRGDYFRIQILVSPQGSSVGDGIEIVLPVPPNLNIGAHPPPPISHSFTSPLPPCPLPSCEAPMMHIQISHQPTEGHVHFLFLLPWFSMPSSESHMGKSQKRKEDWGLWLQNSYLTTGGNHQNDYSAGSTFTFYCSQ